MTSLPAADGLKANLLLFLFDFQNSLYQKQKVPLMPMLFRQVGYHVWAGLAFEQVCWDHNSKIKQKLGIPGIYSETSTWAKSANTELGGKQIDLVIDRKDRVINLFEIKYSTSIYTITKEYDLKLRNKLSIFKETTKKRKSVFLSMISTYGITQNEYAKSIVQNDLTMDDLF